MSGKLSGQKQYYRDFPKEKRRAALRQALDIRKFEIDLYWKRADYFWKFIGATFGGYFAIAIAQKHEAQFQEYLVLLGCLGLVLSYGWFCANKGSKQWQENWENHVDMLEDDSVGPLYKTTLTRHASKKWMFIKDFFTGPGAFSVSKINQLISFAVFLIWVALLLDALSLFRKDWDVSGRYTIFVVLAVAACVAFHRMCKTHFGNQNHKFSRRVSVITEGQSKFEE